MVNKGKDLPNRQYKILIQFWIGGEEIVEDNPSGKVALSGAYELDPDGEKELRNSLAQFFGKVILMVADMAKKLSLYETRET